MRILQICAAYKPAFVYGGPTMSVSMLSEQLIKAGIYAEVYATTANGKEELTVTPGVPLNVDGVTVTYFNRITKDHSHFSPALLRKLWKEAPAFNIVHIHAWWNLVSLFSCLVALLRNVPVLVSPRGTLSSYSFHNKNTGYKALIHRLMGKPLLKRCHIHVTSDGERSAIEELVTAKSITNVPNFVRLPENVINEPRPDGVFRLIFFSRIEEKKGLDILIGALPLLTIPYRLTVAGDGEPIYVDRLKHLTEEHAVNEHIDWVGFQGEGKFDLLRKNDLLVLPSYDENFGNVVIESLSQGTAVLLSRFVGLAGYVAKNNFGWECELSAASVSEMINSICLKQAELDGIRLRAPARIRSDFDERHLIEQYTSMYNKIING